MKILFAIAIAAALTSCSTVESVQAVGSKPADFTRHQLEGIWIDDEDGEEIALVIKDAKLGKMALLSRDDEQELIILKTGGTLFANLKEEGEERYGWAVVRLEGDKLHIKLPDPDAFEELVLSGKIKGKVIESEQQIMEDGGVAPGGGMTVVLDDPKGTWIENLVAGKLGKPWVQDDKQVWRRVRKID